MKLGGFGCVVDYHHIRRAGFSYAELDIPEIEMLSENEFRVFCEDVQETEFPVIVGARALPIAQPWFFTEHFCMTSYRGYLENACRRANLLGIQKIIFGNGKARMLVEESDIKKEKRFIEFVRMFAEIAGNQKIEVILEPVGPKYSNYINTLTEAVRLLHEIDMPNVFTMADLRHMEGAQEPFHHLSIYADSVHHIHMDYPISYPERLFPEPKDNYDYDPFLRELERSGYDGTLTIEADIPSDWNLAYKNASTVLKGGCRKIFMEL